MVCKKLQRERYGFAVELLEQSDEGAEGVPVVRLVGAEHTGKAFRAVKGNPGELAAVVFEKTGSQTDAAACRDVGQGGVVISAVKVFDLPAGDQPVLNGLECRR